MTGRTEPTTTVWVLADQLDRHSSALTDAHPDTHRILVVESTAKLADKAWHRQRAHFIITALRRFADERRAEGFVVDHRRAASLAAGFHAHVAEYTPAQVVAMEPTSRDGLALLHRLGVHTTRSNQFLCHPDEFAAWAAGRRTVRLEDFYRWQRTRLGFLMEGDRPVGGVWNLDHENRKPPPKGPGAAARWPTPRRFPLDEVDRAVLATLPATTFGADPVGWWPTSRGQALERLDEFVEVALAAFGPYEDAMLAENWHLGHSLLSPALNLGLLLPTEVCERVEAAFRAGQVPLQSAEGFLRQVIGWREYVWGLYWAWPDHADQNALEAHDPLPPAFTGAAPTAMRCVATAIGELHDNGWLHHIQRLMVLANLATSAGVDPRALLDWMTASFVDAADWVMIPNVMGMATFADGGRMATKPYVSGGAYLNRMSDYCRGCAFDPKLRVGERACPFTTLYWDVIDRHGDRFARNPRMAQQVRGLDRLVDLPELRERAVEVRGRLAAGTL
jgi:deoxyribodipyrimidine photolyase-related protein